MNADSTTQPVMRKTQQQRIIQPWAVAVLLSGLCLVLYLTTPYFSFLEDETSIISAANAPAKNTLRLFVAGIGQHEHPPLSDLLLHFWLPVAKVSPFLLRLPSEIFYVVGILVLALTSRKLVGERAFDATLIIGIVWPFGFHFGRLVGWYSFCFLLISLFTLAYVSFIDAQTWPKFWLVVAIAYAAVLTNYFAWAVIGMIAIDLLCISLKRGTGWKFVAAGGGALLVGYAPIWIAFTHELLHHPANVEGTRGALSTALRAAFNLYSLFVSESVAPWFFKVSVPVTISIAIALVCTFRLSQGRTRRLFLGFCILFGILAALGVVETKRTLFISGWLLVPLGCAVARVGEKHTRALLIGSLIVIAAVGWIGIVKRDYYSAPHFTEPWEKLAEEAAQGIGEGKIIVSNSPSFLFYLNAETNKSDAKLSGTPGWAEGPNVISLLHNNLMPARPNGQYLLVRGTNTVPETEKNTKAVEALLLSRCQVLSVDKLLKDSGYALKKKYFRSDSNDPYRITVELFDCETHQ